MIRFHAEREGEEEEEWEKAELLWSVSRPFSPRVDVLSLQQRLSVALRVAQWLTNMRPSRRISPVSEKASKTNTPTQFLDSSNIFLPFPPFHFDGWWSVQSCGPTVLSWCEPNPSGTQYPVYQLSALWKPQQYWAEAEVQNSLQFVQVTAKVEVFFFSVTLPCRLRRADSFFSFSNLQMLSCFVSKSPSNHIWSSSGGPIDNWLSWRKSEFFDIALLIWNIIRKIKLSDVVDFFLVYCEPVNLYWVHHFLGFSDGLLMKLSFCSFCSAYWSYWRPYLLAMSGMQSVCCITIKWDKKYADRKE